MENSDGSINVLERKRRPLIVHVIHRLDIGGLENGLVNLINRLPEDKYAHAIVCMDDYSGFRNRIERDDVQIIAIRKKPGRDPMASWRLFRLFRRLRPDIVHTRNLSGLDALLPSALAGVPHRIHGEHGRDIDDLLGNNLKLQWLRRIHRPMVDRYVPVSKELERYLEEKIGVPAQRITRIYNGVDTDRFLPASKHGLASVSPKDVIFPDDAVVIGAVGRVQAVKGQMILADAMIELLRQAPDLRQNVRLMMIGGGPLYEDVTNRFMAAGFGDIVWAPGPRDDIECLLRVADVFVQPSLAEGISNTLLEAMATGLPAIATRVGGNPELVLEGETGTLVDAGNVAELASQLERYVRDPELRMEQGRKARVRAKSAFTIGRMIRSYMAVYDQVLSR